MLEAEILKAFKNLADHCRRPEATIQEWGRLVEVVERKAFGVKDENKLECCFSQVQLQST